MTKLLRIGTATARLLAWWVLLCASIALAQSASATDMGRLAPYLPQDEHNSPWVFKMQDQGFTMSNVSDPRSIQYFYVLPEHSDEGARRIETTVLLSEESRGGGGVLFRFDPDTRNYFVFAVENDGSTKIFRRDQNGFDELADFGPLARVGATNTLTLIESPTQVEFFLNGERTGVIEGVSGGGVGIVGLGAVRATFSNFRDDAKQNASRETPQALQPVNTSSAPQAPLRLVPNQIVDQTAPFGPTVAYDIMIPEGWKTEGGIVWNPPNDCHRGGQLSWGVESPDGAYSLSFVPPISWSWSSVGGGVTGCVYADLPDAEAVVRQYLALAPELQARNVSITRPPELAPVAQQLASQIPPLPDGRLWVDAVLVQAEVMDDGQPSEMSLLLFTMHSLTGAGGFWVRGGNTLFGLAVETPPGEHEAGHPAFAPILANMKPRPQWNRAVMNWWTKQLKPRPGARTSSASSNGASISDMMHESYKRRQAMQEEGHSKLIDSVWETQKYETSDGVVPLSQNYRNAWELNDGSIVLTDDDSFNPVQTFNEFGTQLRPVE